MIIKNFLNLPFLKNVINYEYEEDILLELNDYNNIVDITCKICFGINLKLNINKCEICTFLICENCKEHVNKCPICKTTVAFKEDKIWLSWYLKKYIKLYCNFCNRLDCKINFNYGKLINTCESKKLKDYKYIKSYYNFKDIYLIKNKESEEFKFTYWNIQYHGFKYYNHVKYNSYEKFIFKENSLEYIAYSDISKKSVIKIKFGEILFLKIKKDIDIDDLKKYLNYIKNNKKSEYLNLIYESSIKTLTIKLLENPYELELCIYRICHKEYSYQVYHKLNGNEIIYDKKDIKVRFTFNINPYEILLKNPNLLLNIEHFIKTTIKHKDVISFKNKIITVKSKNNKLKYIFKYEVKQIYLLYSYNLVNFLDNLEEFYNELKDYLFTIVKNTNLNLEKVKFNCKLNNDYNFIGYLENPYELKNGVLYNNYIEYTGEFKNHEFYGQGVLKLKYKEGYFSKWLYFSGNWKKSQLDTNSNFKIYTKDNELYIQINYLENILHCKNITENMKYNEYFNKVFKSKNELLINYF